MIALLAALAFSSVDEAAVAALTECKRITTRWECGGYIWRSTDGLYRYTAPVNGGEQTSIDLSPVYLFAVRAGFPLVADYHTHPCVGYKPIDNVFSMQDVLSDKGLHLAGYMLNICNGTVHRWAEGDPEDDIEVDYESGAVMYLASGHIVGFVYESSTIRPVQHRQAKRAEH